MSSTRDPLVAAIRLAQAARDTLGWLDRTKPQHGAMCFCPHCVYSVALRQALATYDSDDVPAEVVNAHGALAIIDGLRAELAEKAQLLDAALRAHEEMRQLREAAFRDGEASMLARAVAAVAHCVDCESAVAGLPLRGAP